MADPAEHRLAGLRRRWDEDRSSTAFVPLAEEYRRLGRLQDALTVLEQGMKAAPNYLSARVALGRCRLDLGDAQGASEMFEQVVQQDPTQLVASKLLVDAYLRSGRPQQARERLNLYAVLNDRDPELDDLRRRVQQAARDAEAAEFAALPVAEVTEEPEFEWTLAPEPVSETSTAALDAAHQERHEAPVPDPPPISASIAALGSSGEVFRLPPVEAPRPVLDGLAPRARPPRPSSAGTVFEGLGTAGARRRYVAALLHGEVFGTPAPQAAEPAASPAAAPRTAPPVVGPQDAESMTASPTPRVVSPASAVAPVWTAPANPPSAEEVWTEEVPDEPLEATVPQPPGPVEATATLGELYLSQGHSREAESIFQRVLETQPDNPAAREGLQTARRGAESGPRPGVTARKIEFLQSYLKRLRKVSERHVS